MSPPIALVTGATGAIGPSLIHHLLTDGYVIRMYSRHSPAPEFSPPNVEHISGDINDIPSLIYALRGVNVVFHLAAFLHVENPSQDVLKQYQEINVSGTQNVVNEAIKANVQRIVYFSTVKVYGEQGPDPISEGTPTQPRTIYAQTKLQGEAIVRAAQGIDTVILRLSPVYGPRLRGSWERLVKAIAQGRFIPVGSLQNRRSLTYVEDVARGACLVAEHPEAAGEIYNVVGHEGVSMYEILTAIYRALDKPLPPIRIPTIPTLVGVIMLEKGLSLIKKRSPLTLDNIHNLLGNEVYAGNKLRQLGLDNFISLSEGWQKTVKHLDQG